MKKVPMKTHTRDCAYRYWKVKSEDGKRVYLVQRMNGKFSCTCKGFEFRKDCKHVGAVSKK